MSAVCRWPQPGRSSHRGSADHWSRARDRLAAEQNPCRTPFRRRSTQHWHPLRNQERPHARRQKRSPRRLKSRSGRQISRRPSSGGGNLASSDCCASCNDNTTLAAPLSGSARWMRPPGTHDIVGRRCGREGKNMQQISRREILELAAAGGVALTANGFGRARAAELKPRIEQFDPAFEKIVSTSEPIRTLATGFGGGGNTEGPVWWKEGGFLL